MVCFLRYKKLEKFLSDCHEHKPQMHGSDCGDTAILHDGHTDYLHNGHLHHPHGDHCEDHSPIDTVPKPLSAPNVPAMGAAVLCSFTVARLSSPPPK
jgi:hypothetical protein